MEETALTLPYTPSSIHIFHLIIIFSSWCFCWKKSRVPWWMNWVSMQSVLFEYAKWFVFIIVLTPLFSFCCFSAVSCWRIFWTPWICSDKIRCPQTTWQGSWNSFLYFSFSFRFACVLPGKGLLGQANYWYWGFAFHRCALGYSWGS